MVTIQTVSPTISIREMPSANVLIKGVEYRVTIQDGVQPRVSINTPMQGAKGDRGETGVPGRDYDPAELTALASLITNVQTTVAGNVNKVNLVSGNNFLKFSDGASGVTPNLLIGTRNGKAAALVAGTSGTVFTFDRTGSFSIGSDFRANLDSGGTGGGSSHLTVFPTGDVSIPLKLTTARFNLPHESSPATRANGDLWTTTAGLFGRINNLDQMTCSPFSGR